MPYTPILTVFGVILGLADKLWVNNKNQENVDGNIIHKTTESYHNPDPALVFLIFLPALIFESAFNSDWYTFRR